MGTLRAKNFRLTLLLLLRNPQNYSHLERRDKARKRCKESTIKAHLNRLIDINLFQVVLVSKVASSSENNGSRNYKSLQVLIVLIQWHCDSS